MWSVSYVTCIGLIVTVSLSDLEAIQWHEFPKIRKDDFQKFIKTIGYTKLPFEHF